MTFIIEPREIFSFLCPMKKILFPTEFGPLGEKARDTVGYLAEKYKAEVWIFHSVPRTNVVTRLFFGADPERNELEAIEHLDECAAQLNRDRNLEVNTVVGVGKPEEAIVQAAEEKGTDLIVFGTKGDTGWLTEIKGTAVNYVIQHAPCPVLTLLRKPREMGFERVLVVSDPAESALEHVDWALSLGKSFKFIQHYNPRKTSVEALASEDVRILEKANAAGITDYKFQDLEFGNDPAQDIFEVAEQFRADLIVLMEFDWDTEEDDDTPVGSLVEEIVEHSEVPVLTVRHGHRGPQ